MTDKHLRRKRIRERLAKFDMTASMLAEMLNVDAGHLSKVINNRTDPSFQLARRIARALKTTTIYLKLN